jgi:hypothetical protein
MKKLLKNKSKSRSNSKSPSKDKEIVGKEKKKKVVIDENILSEEQESTKKKRSKDRLPQNINDYKHLMDSIYLTGKDIEWVLKLRGHKKKKPGEEEKNKNIVPPSFFLKDNTHYFEVKEQLEKNALHRLWNHTGNSRDFEHLMNKRVGEKTNSTQLSYETNLRVFPPKCRGPLPKFDWHPITTLRRSNSQVPRILAPLLPISSKNLENLGNLVVRPYDRVYVEVLYFFKIGCKCSYQ